MKKTVFIFCLFALITILFGASVTEKFSYGKIKLGMSLKAVKDITPDANCMYFKKYTSMVCGDYENAALLLKFGNEVLTEMTVKMDSDKPDRQFNDAVTVMKKVYGEVSQLNKKKRFALFITKEGAAGVEVKKNKSGHSLFYIFCKDRDCAQLKKVVSE